MKKYILSIFLILICYIGYGQYPITTNLGSPSTLLKNPNYGGIQGGLVPYTFADTTSANTALTYLKTYNGALVYTTSDSALYFRCCGATKWQQILPSGGSSGLRAWLIGGQGGLFTSPVDAQIIGVTTNQPFGFMTNNVNRVIVPAAGLSLLTLQSDTTLNKPMTYNTSTKEWNYGYWFGSGSGVTTMAAIGSSPNANGATISGSTLNLQPASTSFGGVVTTSTQGFTGFKYFPSNIGLGTASASIGSTHLITGTLSSTGFVRINLSNTNSGNGSGVGAIYTNDVGGDLQYYQGSSTNSYIPDGAYIHSSGAGGFRFVNSGAGSKIRWSTSNSVGINTGAYLGWDANEFYHIAIPQAASTSAKTVLLYDTASGGYFSQISLDSIGGGGGSGTVNSGTQYRLGYYATTGTAISEAAAITANRALISDANGVPTHATTTATQLGYLSSATGTTGTASTNLVFSTSPALTTPTVATSITPASNDGAAIGTTALQFSDLFLAEGGVINWDNGDATLTQVGNSVTLDGAAFLVTSPSQTPASFSSSFAGNMQVNWNSTTSNNVNFVFQEAGTPTWYIGNNASVDRLHILNSAAAEVVTVLQGQQVGINKTAPTARLHIGAGLATASYAPLKFTTGTNNTTAEAGAMEYTTPQLFFTNGRAVRQEIFQGQQSRVSTQYDNTTTTLGNVTGLTANVAASGTYRFEAKLYTTSDVAGGIKVAIGGTATATAIRYEGLTTDAGLTTQGRATALGTAVGAVTAVTAAYVVITGTITVNAAGTITVQAAANAATGTTSVLTGSTFVITEML